MSVPVDLYELHPSEYEHPFDKKALGVLRSTPGLDKVMRYCIKHSIERTVTIIKTGSGLKITKDNYPKIYQILDRVCDIIHLTSRPDLYLEYTLKISGSTTGDDHPIIILSSGAIDHLSEQELLFVIGHEVGHIKSRHMLYHMMAQILPKVAAILGKSTLGVGELLSQPLQFALLKWSRMSEFTADRAGLLACQSLEVAGRVMMKLAGMPICYYNDMNVDSFIQQAKSFEELDYDNLNKMMKFLFTMNNDHPWTVLRTAELLKWIEGGEYDQVVQRKTCGLVP